MPNRFRQNNPGTQGQSNNKGLFTSRKEIRKQKKEQKKVKKEEYYRQKVEHQVKSKAAASAKRDIVQKGQKSTSKKKLGKQNQTPQRNDGAARSEIKDQKSREWQESNLKEIDNLDREIEYLEGKLGVRNDKKKKEKINKQGEREGLGIGFLSFLDGISGKVKDSAYKAKLARGEKPGEYDFNDDAKEVLLEFPTIDGSVPDQKVLAAPKGGESDDDNQEGFSELSDLPSDEEEADDDDDYGDEESSSESEEPAQNAKQSKQKGKGAELKQKLQRKKEIGGNSNKHEILMNDSESSIEDDLLDEDGSDDMPRQKVQISENGSDESEIVDDMSSTEWNHIKVENSSEEGLDANEASGDDDESMEEDDYDDESMEDEEQGESEMTQEQEVSQK